MNKSLQENIKSCLLSKFGNKFEKEKRYVIAVQGSSSSGKTTFANHLHHILINRNINSLLINLDNFYKTPDNPSQEDENYDFDNPASLNWDKIFNVFRAIRDNEPYIPVSHRRKDKNQNEIQENIENPFPQVIIVEGIYSFNCVNKFKFNLDDFDPAETFKPIKQEFLIGEDVLGDMKALKIFLPLCKNKFKSIRTARDIKVNKPLNLIESRFERMIWPDTLKWVYSSIESNDLHVVHGNFNSKMINQVLKTIVEFFTENDSIEVEALIENHSNDFKVDCSGECLDRVNTNVLLDDN